MPMVAGENMLGVINFESTCVGRFAPEAVKTLWYAAIEAAIAFRYFREVDRTRKIKKANNDILMLSQRMAQRGGDKRSYQNALAKLVSSSLKADRCNIWLYNSRAGFVSVGSTHPSTTKRKPPRKQRGWSRFVYKTKWPVCITNVKAENDFRVFFWNPTEQRWQVESPRKVLPSTVSPELLRLNMQCEFGVPIFLRKRCIGVAWVKYEQKTSLPDVDFISFATEMLGRAGLVAYVNDQGPVCVPSQTTMFVASEIGQNMGFVIRH